ncbi:hypothetical protein [Pedobacter kyonggii]|uniref:Uncharacterized protein n=1 Tax=Pedobacter kyonggii TaxID=1926871 RepID=A0A4Q9HE60_9SPHI|nr:hypothetical protein [Pedobacter kyonggii]TBO42883.1 hypothetical protein EYS08_08795 [Pedobacter kyonggii]
MKRITDLKSTRKTAFVFRSQKAASKRYFTVLENRKTSKDTGKNRWLPTLRVGACLSCVWAFCGASKADIGLTHAFLWIVFPNQITFSSTCQLQNSHYPRILSSEVS